MAIWSPAYIGLNIAVSLNLLLCASHHLTQLSDRFVRDLVALACQLALMLNVHILFSCESRMLGMRSGVERSDLYILTANMINVERGSETSVNFLRINISLLQKSDLSDILTLTVL